MKLILKIITSLLPVVAIICAAAAVLAWADPKLSPPNGNVAGPINTGAEAQTRSGVLGIGDANFANSSTTYYIKNSAGSLQLIPGDPANAPSLVVEGNGNVGIGTTAPLQLLDVNGSINGQSGLCIDGQCCTRWYGCFEIPFKRTSKTCGTGADSCGLNIVLVVDHSGSINDSALLQMKNAFTNFVNILSGTPSEFAVVEFSSYALVRQEFTANMDSVRNGISMAFSSKSVLAGHSTNWQDAFVKADELLKSLNSRRKNLVIFASDGNPNTCNCVVSGGRCKEGSLSCTETRALSLAETQAQAITDSGTQIIALALGRDLDKKNMDAIANPKGSYAVEKYEDLGAVLSGIATKLCGGTINVRKVIDADGNLKTTKDQISADNIELANWKFVVANRSDKITDNNGKTDAVCVLSSQGPFSVTEQDVPLKSGYNFDGAVCDGSSRSNGTLSIKKKTITGIQVGNTDILKCTFYNSPIPLCTASSTISCSADFKCLCPEGSKCVAEKCCKPACAKNACGANQNDGCGGKIDCTKNCSATDKCYKDKCCAPACAKNACGAAQDDGCGGKIDCGQCNATSTSP